MNQILISWSCSIQIFVSRGVTNQPGHGKTKYKIPLQKVKDFSLNHNEI